MNKKIKTAIIVISHNAKDMTNNLCDKIIRNTKSPYDLLVVETGSKKEELSNYPTLLLPEGIRGTRGMNWGIKWFLWKEKFNPVHYDSFWICVNDAIFEEKDILTPLVNFLRRIEDCGEIHPYYHSNSNNDLDQQKKEIGFARKESFCEIVCPLFSRDVIEIPNLLDERFFYLWGLDYDIPYILHKNNKRLYVSNEVMVEHHGGTTAINGKDEEFTTRKAQYDISRENMKKGLVEKYGVKWGEVINNAIPPDVSHSKAFYHWVTRNGDYVFK